MLKTPSEATTPISTVNTDANATTVVVPALRPSGTDARRAGSTASAAAAAADTVATADTRRQLAALTPREREVLTLMGHGRSNSALAHELTLSEATVKTHVARIFAKLSLRDRAQAVVLAYETGLVAPGSVTPERQAPPAGSGPRR